MSTYKETVWLKAPERGARAKRADKKHHELKSFGRFWYLEIPDFLNTQIDRTLLLFLPSLFFFFVVCPSLSPALALRLFPRVFSLFSLGEQSHSKERPKERPRQNRQPHAEAAAAVAATVAEAFRPKPGAGIQQGGVAFDFVRFYWGGQGSRCARACEAYLAHNECRGPCLRATSVL
jgi:hypothetical protein